MHVAVALVCLLVGVSFFKELHKHINDSALVCRLFGIVSDANQLLDPNVTPNTHTERERSTHTHTHTLASMHLPHTADILLTGPPLTGLATHNIRLHASPHKHISTSVQLICSLLLTRQQ